MEDRGGVSTPTPTWREAALIARRLGEATTRQEEGHQAGDKPKKRRSRSRGRGWHSKRAINKEFVRVLVDGEYPYPDISRAEAVLVALQLRDRGFSAPFIAKRIGVSERTVFRMYLDGKKLGQQS